MLKVGLTGGLASGKTFVARLLEELGCHLLRADRLGHEVLRPGGEAREDVIGEFGRDILTANGEIDRKALGALVFADPVRLKALNALVHPHVFRRQEEWFRALAGREPADIGVVEAAIMIESGSYKRYDKLILTACPAELQIARYREREGASEDEARARLAHQMPLSEKRKYADYIVDTSGSEEETGRQVRGIYRRLKEESP
jgi:dephospho-CoA kinase